jgi:nicotinamidase-related amidase
MIDNVERRNKMSNWEMKGKPTLIIIHMQHSVVSEDGNPAFHSLAETVKKSGIILKQQALLERFRNKKLPVFYVVAAWPYTVKFPAYGKFWDLHATARPNLAGSKDTEVIPELSPLSGEPVINSWPISSFSNSNLQQLLKEQGIETLVLVGVATEHAVLATSLQAADFGYSLIVPNDACTSFNIRAHDMVLNDMLPGIALVTTTKDVIAHI